MKRFDSARLEGCGCSETDLKSLLATKVKALKKELSQTLASGPSNTTLFQDLARLIPVVWLQQRNRDYLSSSLSLLLSPGIPLSVGSQGGRSTRDHG